MITEQLMIDKELIESFLVEFDGTTKFLQDPGYIYIITKSIYDILDELAERK